MRQQAKLAAIAGFICFGMLAACGGGQAGEYSIAADASYEASLFRQNCAICHGREGRGKTLDDGTIVPSLRAGEFKARTESEIYRQIADGGNGMLAFRRQLTEREMQLLVKLIRDELRKQKD